MVKTKMENQTLDIVKLIEKNPITRLDKDYNDTLILKIKDSFTEPEQQLFVASFFCYLDYNPKKDFVINFDTVWKWLGFTRKDHCKVVLKKHFVNEIDYTIFSPDVTLEKAAPEVAGAAFVEKNIGCTELNKEFTVVNIGGAGLNKEKIMLNINCFKKLCLKANTKKADEIHNYYIKIEELILDTVNEQTSELRLQLLQNNIQFINDKQTILLHSFHLKSILYLIKIKLNLYKFGNTDDIRRRLSEHHMEIGEDIQLIFCIESKNNVLLENNLKKYLTTTNFRKKETFNNKIQTELIEIQDISIIENKLKDFNKIISQDKESLTIERLKLETENLKCQIKLLQLQNNSSEKYKQEINEFSSNTSEKYKQEINEISSNTSEKCKQEINEISSNTSEKFKQELNEIPSNTSEMCNKDREKKEKKNRLLREYRQKNRDILLLKKREYYQKNKEKINRSAHEYRQKNRDVLLIKKLEYYHKNKIEINQRRKKS